MGTPTRTLGNTQISISLHATLLAEIDARTKALGGISRSVYITSLIRKDITEGGDLVLKETVAGSPAKETVTVRKYPAAARKGNK